MTKSGLFTDIHGRPVMALRPSSRVQNISFTGSSAASTTFLAVSQFTGYNENVTYNGSVVSGTTHVRLVSTADCFVVFGSSPTASTSTGLFLPANCPEYFPVDVGDQVAVVQSTAAGSLNIVECQ